MPVTTNEATIASSYVPQGIVVPLDNHFVNSVIVVDIQQNTTPVEAWVQIYLTSGDSAISNRVATLSQGYVGTGQDCAWTGRIIADPHTFLVASIMGPATARYRMSATVYKIITMEGGTVIVDP